VLSILPILPLLTRNTRNIIDFAKVFALANRNTVRNIGGAVRNRVRGCFALGVGRCG
jgi:hypothetical protein